MQFDPTLMIGLRGRDQCLVVWAQSTLPQVRNKSPWVGALRIRTRQKPTDPNSVIGPAGFGSQRFVPINQMPYVITFENEATATAPAQVVEVTQQLDSNLDWSTFQLVGFDFGGQAYAIPSGLTTYSTRIDAIGSVGVYVEVDANFDPLTGRLTWTFTSLDPTTFDVPEGNELEGFLPPDVTPPEGDAFVEYSVLPKATDPTGTVINRQASPSSSRQDCWIKVLLPRPTSSTRSTTARPRAA